MIADTGQILDTASTNQNNGVFLKVVPYPWDIRRNFYTIRQTDSSNLAKGRVGLLGSYRVNTRTNPPALRIFL